MTEVGWDGQVVTVDLTGPDPGSVEDLTQALADEVDADAEVEASMHRLIQRVTDEYERWSYNTAVAGFMEQTNLLYKYSPEYTCLLMGAKTLIDEGGYVGPGGNGRSLVLDAGIAFGDDPYHYPKHLPIVGAKGGPGGKPGCGSLPDVSKNWPVRQLVTNTGFGTGVDWRPNPGIAFPMYANYFPATRGYPEPPSVRNLFGGPAIGPIPYPGAPAYGAQLYAPDGTPLWPGLPPAPPPGAPRDPGPTPGSEPFVVPNPATMQPTAIPWQPVPPPVPAIPGQPAPLPPFYPVP